MPDPKETMRSHVLKVTPIPLCGYKTRAINLSNNGLPSCPMLSACLAETAQLWGIAGARKDGETKAT